MHRVFDPEDQRTIRRWFIRVVAFYFLLALVVVAFVAVKINFLDPQISAMKSGFSTGTLRANRFVDASSASAANRVDISECISRGRRLFTSIKAHREARDIPDDRLSDALSAVMKARTACNTGRLDDALAIYDSIMIAPTNPRGNEAAPTRRLSLGRDHEPFVDFR